ncbi:hypothetical protein B0187_02730 [Haemophilus paracuniculus]|uniref:Glutaredoxin n=1 Tax=Haemophilus paracuniculus TaxID=734 RepID=A0A1T0ATC8_9PAST|nr:hypothetical protein [Haemophilus paracuniculus]OOR99740.1 hypothetical protein B0187_02730 [Haemophilus paracuniculus]
MKPILYFSALCPDTAPFVAELQRLGVEYESVDILENLANLKRFTKLRDQHSAFDEAKENGYLGIPALEIEWSTWGNGVILEVEKLKSLVI